MNHKILAVTNFNDHEAYVLRDEVVLEYEQFDDVIIGTDGVFYNFYYCAYQKGFSAFAGRKFDIHLKNGKIVHCAGQWWDGANSKTFKTLNDEFNVDYKNMVRVTARDVTALERCYVYTGYVGVQHKVEELRKAYGGKVYEYHDYEKRMRYIRCSACNHQTGSHGNLFCEFWHDSKYVGNCKYKTKNWRDAL